MQIFPEIVVKIWNGWEVRVLVGLSLLLQIILIIFGSRRKYIAGWWISAVVWLAYLSADSVATVALGVLASNQGEDSGKPNLLQAFWAPFLLWHLGGPDTITSYSLEDNELWPRHLLGLVSQLAVAFYVYLRSWSDNALSFLTIPVFIAGLVKYSERTWVLRFSSSKHFRESLLSNHPGQGDNERQVKYVPRGPCPPSSTAFFHRAHYLFRISSNLFQDLILGFSEQKDSHQIISSVDNSSGAFELIEIELSLTYDTLHTKSPIISSKIGNPPTKPISKAIYTLHSKFSNGKKRWSRSMGQYNLISCCLKAEPPELVKLLGIDELIEHKNITWTNVNDDVRNSVFRHVLEKGNTIMNKIRDIEEQANKIIDEFKKLSEQQVPNVGEHAAHVQQLQESLNGLKEHVRAINETRIVSQQGNYTGVFAAPAKKLRDAVVRSGRYGVLIENISPLLESLPFTDSIIVWHVATNLCYYRDLENNANTDMPNLRISKMLSDYMLYLLAMSPDMLPKGNQTLWYLCKDTQTAIGEVLLPKETSYNIQEACSKLLEMTITINDIVEQGRSATKKYSVLSYGCGVARVLKEQQLSERWEIVSEVWVEILVFGAIQSDWKQHAQLLRRGGEFITHIRLLAVHLSLIDQFDSFDI